MLHLQVSTTLLGLGLAAVIMVLLRRDHLHLSHGLFWICVAIGSSFLGLSPGLIDRAAALLGFSNPPAMVLLGAVVILFIKSLHNDILNTRIERQMRRLNQRLAIYEMERPVL
jgi:hypothetical protein